MKKAVKIAIIACCIVANTFGMDRAKALQPKHVLVPLEGFLFSVDAFAALSEMGMSGAYSSARSSGWRSSLKSLWGVATGQGPDQKALASKFFSLLNTMSYEPACDAKTAPKVLWQGLESPHIVVHGWLQGNKKCADLLSTVHSHIQTNASTTERACLEKCAQLMLDPQKNSATLKSNADALELIKKLCALGHTIHVVDNWNAEAFDALQAKHATAFEHITGDAFISGKVGKVKSTNATVFQDAFFEQHAHIKPADCVVVEIQEEYVAPIRNKPFTTVLCKDSNVRELHATLQKLGLLGDQ